MSRFQANGLEWGIGLHEPDPEGWMRAHVLVRVPGFEGGFDCGIELREWGELIKALERLEGSVGSAASESWATMEANIELEFSLMQTGHVKGQYVFRSSSEGPALAGSFQADQTYLPQWIDHARRALPRLR